MILSLLLKSKDRDIYVEKQEAGSFFLSTLREKKCVLLSACLLKGERDE